ncbi:MAG TPA: tail fiber domain-containing protein, partial [Terriglobales bacterium]|nr:tail fiber domain-containing protein [Terriglobales bacterium]
TGFATVAGGSSNNARGEYSTVGGGGGNIASGQNSTVGGGFNNNASGQGSTIGGGHDNFASNDFSTVAGGNTNLANGLDATVAGGTNNIASGTNSFAAGHHANTNFHQGGFAWGDNSTSTDVSVTADNQFVARTSGGVIFFTNSFMTTGVQVAAGGGSWASVSDRKVKANFAAIDGKKILAKLALLPVETWNYTSQDAAIRHIGPMAQDFYAAFQVGEDDRHITQVDEGGVAFAAIQGLNQKLEEEIRHKDAALAAQQRQIEALQLQVREMMTRIAVVENASARRGPVSQIASSR